MKSFKTSIIAAALCCVVPVSAQKMFATEKYAAACSYYGETISGDVMMYDSDPAAERVVQNIMSVIGLRSNFQMRASQTVPTAAAVILKSKRYILYNPKFMNDIVSASGNNWSAISILAHEIGHHLSGHTLDKVGSRPATELEADEFSGFVLRKMGASLADAQAAMGLIASVKGSHTHPPKSQRLNAIAAGWGKAAGYDNSAVAQAIAVPAKAVPATAPKTVAAPPAQTRTERLRKSTLSSQYIASDAYFTTNPKGEYYLTVRGNLVLVENENVYLIGSLAESNKPGYKMMLSGENANIYIDSRGGLVSNTGKRVGYLKARE